MLRSNYRQGQIVRYSNAPSSNEYRIIKVFPAVAKVPAAYMIQNLKTVQVVGMVAEATIRA